MSTISSGNNLLSQSSCSTKTASSYRAISLARVDFPAAILPQKQTSFPCCCISLFLNLTLMDTDRSTTIPARSPAPGS
ncbi:MAG: hypothetical protein ACUVQO_05780 [Leptodesmis sp.]